MATGVLPCAHLASSRSDWARLSTCAPTAHASTSHEDPLDSAIILSGNGSMNKLTARDVLNRPLDARLSEAWPDAGAVPEQFDRLYRGGPVAPNKIIFLVRSRERIDSGLRVLDDVYLSGDPDLLKKIVAAEVKVGSLRAYAGYAGWAPRQLQAEITAGGWYLVPADADTIFAKDVAVMWPELIRKITLRSTSLPLLDAQSVAGRSATR